MTDKQVAASVEALLTGRPAKPFQASAEAQNAPKVDFGN